VNITPALEEMEWNGQKQRPGRYDWKPSAVRLCDAWDICVHNVPDVGACVARQQSIRESSHRAVMEADGAV